MLVQVHTNTYMWLGEIHKLVYSGLHVLGANEDYDITIDGHSSVITGLVRFWGPRTEDEINILVPNWPHHCRHCYINNPFLLGML